MTKERCKLIDEAVEAVNGLIGDSTECVAALLGYQCTSKKAYQTVLREHSNLVAVHALLVFMDSRYEERFPPDGKEGDKDHE